MKDKTDDRSGQAPDASPASSSTRWVIRDGSPLLAGAMPRVPHAGALEIDLSSLEFVTPFDLVALVGLLDQIPNDVKVVLRPPANPFVSNYLLRMNFPTIIPYGITISPPFPAEWPRDETPALIELQRLQHAREIATIGERVWDKVLRQLSEDGCKMLFRMAGELVDNAASHGQSRHGALVAAQHYSGATSGMPPGMWLAIADSGVGIRRHLLRNPGVLRGIDDARAIRMAWHGGLSGTGDPARGWGLSEVRATAGSRSPARLVIRSGFGEAWYFAAEGGPRTARYVRRSTPYRGTIVLVQAGLAEADQA